MEAENDLKEIKGKDKYSVEPKLRLFLEHCIVCSSQSLEGRFKVNYNITAEVIDSIRC